MFTTKLDRSSIEKPLKVQLKTKTYMYSENKTAQNP